MSCCRLDFPWNRVANGRAESRGGRISQTGRGSRRWGSRGQRGQQQPRETRLHLRGRDHAGTRSRMTWTHDLAVRQSSRFLGHLDSPTPCHPQQAEEPRQRDHRPLPEAGTACRLTARHSAATGSLATPSRREPFRMSMCSNRAQGCGEGRMSRVRYRCRWWLSSASTRGRGVVDKS